MSVYNEYVPARRGWMLGMTIPQWVVMLLCMLAVATAFSRKAWAAVALLILAWVIVGVLLLLPVRGRSAIGWLGALVSHAVCSVTGLSVWRSRAATGRGGQVDADLPGALTSIEIHEGAPTGAQMRRMALIQDHVTRTWAISASVSHPGIQLRDRDERLGKARGLTSLIDQMAVGEMVSEVIAIVRTIPDDGAERAQWVRENGSPSAPAGAARIVGDLEEALTGVSVRQEAFVTAVVEESVLARHAREAGRGLPGRGRVLSDVAGELTGALMGGVGMEQVRWMTSPELAAATRTGFAPGDRAGIIDALAERARNPRVNAEVPWAHAGPSAAEAAVRHYAHDAWHSVSVTLQLPDRGAAMGALLPVLTPSEPEERRSLAVVWPIKTLKQADREISRSESMADLGDALNEKLKRTSRAKDRQAAQRTRDLDVKQAQGNSLTAPHAIVTITVPKTKSAADAGRRLETSVRRAGFAPLRLDVSHDVAFCASVVPLGLNLARKGTL